MHEIGVVMEVVKTVENFAKQNGVTKVQTIVLQIGELSPMIPKYVEDCFPAAVDGTSLQDTELKIEILPANAMCKKCNKVFTVVEHNKICPNCGSNSDWEVISGKEFLIKEILAC